MPRSKHVPEHLYSRVDKYNLDTLLAEFRELKPLRFQSESMGLGDRKIPTRLSGWKLATHPLCWPWLVERLGAKHAGLSVAHSLIDNRDYRGATGFFDWIVATHGPSPNPLGLAAVQLREWLDGTRDSAVSARENRAGNLPKNDVDAVTLFLWDLVQRRDPAYAAGGRMQHGLTNELASEVYKGLGVDLTTSAVRERLKRFRTRMLNTDK